MPDIGFLKTNISKEKLPQTLKLSENKYCPFSTKKHCHRRNVMIFNHFYFYWSDTDWVGLYFVRPQVDKDIISTNRDSWINFSLILKARSALKKPIKSCLPDSFPVSKVVHWFVIFDIVWFFYQPRIYWYWALYSILKNVGWT